MLDHNSVPTDLRDGLERKFKKEGFVVLPRTIKNTHLQRLHKDVSRTFLQKRRDFAVTPTDPAKASENHDSAIGIDFRPEGANHDVNRWNVLLPSNESCVDIDGIFGADTLRFLHEAFVDPICFIAGADIPTLGSTIQSAHQDMDKFGVSLQISLVDIDECNAPLEVWPGSHRVFDGEKFLPFSTSSFWHTDEQLRKIVNSTVPVKIKLRPGELLIRDHRLVHRGTKNFTPDPRFMLSYWVRESCGEVPHTAIRSVALKIARLIRRRGRGAGMGVADPLLYDMGNSLTLRTYSLSETDRIGARRLSREVWNKMSDDTKRLFRNADTDFRRQVPRSLCTYRKDFALIRLLFDNARNLLLIRKNYRKQGEA